MPINDTISKLPTWLERFWARVDKSGDCWIWTGLGRNQFGHGCFSKGNRQPRIWCHRLSYELLVGPIADGLVIDHLCNNPGCVNPEHLRACTQKENLLRSNVTMAGINARKETCKNGHQFDTRRGHSRSCRTCERVKSAKWRKDNPEKSKEVVRRSKNKRKAMTNGQ